MTLSTKEEIAQTWGSHQPVLKAVLQVLKPRRAIECGCGDFSTPHFQSYVPNLLTIEHDPRWADVVMSRYKPWRAHKWLVKSFQATNSTGIDDLPAGEWEKILAYYKNQGQTLTACDFLFVDTLRSARVPAVLGLSCLTPVLLLHDLEHTSPAFYQYERLTEHLEGWHCCMLRPSGKIAKTHRIAWTALYSRDVLDLDALNIVVRKESQKLWGKDFGLELING